MSTPWWNDVANCAYSPGPVTLDRLREIDPLKEGLDTDKCIARLGRTDFYLTRNGWMVTPEGHASISPGFDIRSWTRGAATPYIVAEAEWIALDQAIRREAQAIRDGLSNEGLTIDDFYARHAITMPEKKPCAGCGD